MRRVSAVERRPRAEKRVLSAVIHSQRRFTYKEVL